MPEDLAEEAAPLGPAAQDLLTAGLAIGRLGEVLDLLVEFEQWRRHERQVALGPLLGPVPLIIGLTFLPGVLARGGQGLLLAGFAALGLAVLTRTAGPAPTGPLAPLFDQIDRLLWASRGAAAWVRDPDRARGLAVLGLAVDAGTTFSEGLEIAARVSRSGTGAGAFRTAAEAVRAEVPLPSAGQQCHSCQSTHSARPVLWYRSWATAAVVLGGLARAIARAAARRRRTAAGVSAAAPYLALLIFWLGFALSMALD